MILIFILTIGIVSANDENTTDILNSDDSNEILSEEISVQGDSFKDIQDAVDSSNDGDTIYLNGKTYVGNKTQITISKSLTIDGAGKSTDSKAIIDANDSSRIFYINGKYNVVFKNIIFQKAKINGNGKVILQTGGSLSISNCEFKNINNEYSSAITGGIINIGSNSNIDVKDIEVYNVKFKSSVFIDGFFMSAGANCNFNFSNLNYFNNTLECSGPTSYSSIGQILYSGKNSKVNASKINLYNNKFISSTNLHGVMFHIDDNSKINASDFTFKDNTAISSLSTLASIFINIGRNSNIDFKNGLSMNNNFSAGVRYSAGLIFSHDGGRADIFNITSRNNIMQSKSQIIGSIYRAGINVISNLVNVDMHDNVISTGSLFGGIAYYNSNNQFNLSDVIFYNNKINASFESTTNNSYSAISYSLSDSKSQISNIEANNNRYYSNKYIYGGFLNFGKNNLMNITNLKFYGNYFNTTRQFIGSFIRTNSESNINLSNFIAFNNNFSCYKHSGMIYTGYDITFFVKSINLFENNIFNRYDEAESPFANSSSNYWTHPLVMLYGSGGIYDSSICNNFANESLGVALQVSPSSMENPIIIDSCEFMNNTCGASSKDLNRTYFMDHGGAICVSGGQYIGAAIIRNCLFVNNINSQGGAITPHNNCIVENCRFINNTATKFYGGAISTEDGISSNNANITIRDCYFEGNAAPIGGAIQAKGDYVKIYNCTFKENSAVQGGAVFLEGNNLTLVGCTFIDNNATRSLDERIVIDVDYLPQVQDWNAFGGAVYIHGFNSYVYNNTFKNNYAIHTDSDYEDMGGAVYIFGDNATVIKGYFDDNFAHSGNGSAIYIMGVNATVDLSEFYNHSAGRGTVFIRGSHAEILNSIFKRNTASIDGAGVFSIGNHSLIDNCQFEDNNATVHGGAVYTQGDYIRVINSKFNSNNAHPRDEDQEYGLGGAIFTEGDFNDIAYCDFSLNTARNGSAIYNRGKDLTIEDCNFHYNQAYSYQLDIRVKPVVSIYTKNNRIEINITHIGGDNIINAIYNDGSYKNIYFYNVTYEHSSTDGGKRNSGLTRVNPVESAEKSNNGALIYQDSREDLQIVNVIIAREEYSGLLGASEISGDVIRQFSGRTGLYGNISFALTGDLKPGTYNVYASHPDDRLYKGIENHTRFEITPQVDLKITKSSDRDSYFVGDTATYTITVESLGTDAHDVDVREILPEGFEIVDYAVTKGEFGDNVWYIPVMAEGAKETLTIKVKLDRNGTFTNIVNVTSRENDTDLTNNVANRTIAVKNYVDLEVTKTSDVKKIKVGDTVVWTITVQNKGIINATGVRATDKLPSGLKYISHSSDKGEYDPITGVWSIGELAVNETVVLNITTEALKAGSFTNTVSVTSNEEDRNSSNNEANSTVEVTQDSDDEPSDDPGNYHPGESQSGEGSSDDESKHMKVASGRNATGNPIFLILLVLLSICLTFRRKF